MRCCPVTAACSIAPMRCSRPCRSRRSPRNFFWSSRHERRQRKATPMRKLTLLGATGSIGDSTLDVVARHPERFTVIALAAHSNAAKLADLCRRFRPAYAALSDRDAALAAAAAACARRHADPRARRRSGAGGSRFVARGRYGVGGDRRRGGARAHARSGAHRQAHPARQQGSAGDGRRAVHGRCRRRRRDAAAHRQRAQRDLPVPARALCARPGARRRAAHSADGVGRSRSARGRSPNWRTSRPTRRARIPTGRWAARSRSIRRR